MKRTLFARCTLEAGQYLEILGLRLVGAYLHAMFLVPNTVCGDWGMMADGVKFIQQGAFQLPHLTCSETNSVVPAASSQRPRKISPRKGFSGFFSDPNLSLLLQYCCFNVLRNHFNTKSARFAASGSEAGATKMEGCSVQ